MWPENKERKRLYFLSLHKNSIHNEFWGEAITNAETGELRPAFL
jgi:hypothetical protein